MHPLLKKANEVSGAGRHLARVSHVMGAGEAPAAAPNTALVATPAPAKSMSQYFRDIAAERPKDVPDGIGTIAGAVAGGYLMRGKHPYLGVIGGASLGRNVPALFNPLERGMAMRNLATTGGAVVGSLIGGRKDHGFIGFIIGHLIGGGIAYYGGLGK